MRKTSVKEGKVVVFTNEGSLQSVVNAESSKLNESLQIMSELSKKYGLNLNEFDSLLKERNNYAAVPIGLFRSKLGPLEALVRYMKDMLELSFAQIARMLNRDETTIWMTYSNSSKKGKVIVDVALSDIDFSKLKIKKDSLVIPVSEFSDRRISVLEALSLYLIENFGLSYKNIGILLERNERTVWTCVSRARKKLAK